MSEGLFGVWVVDDFEFKAGVFCRDKDGERFYLGSKEQAEKRAEWFRSEHHDSPHRPVYEVRPFTIPGESAKEPPATTDPRVKVEYLAGALYAEDHREEIARVARDRREGETVQRAEGRVWAVMWERETAAVRERYAVRAVGLLAWMGGGT